MPKYTLHYFNTRGRAELVRLLFHQAGVEFEDHRFEFEEWKEVQKNAHLFPYGSAPTLEVDGKVLPQSVSIARFVANEFGLNGSTNWDKAVCDSVVDTMQDLFSKTFPFVPIYGTEKDEAKREEKKKDYFENVLPRYMKPVEDILKSNNNGKGYLVGNSVTWADLAFMNMADSLLRMNDKWLDKFPLLKELFARVKELPAIKKHLETRPETVL